MRKSYGDDYREIDLNKLDWQSMLSLANSIAGMEVWDKLNKMIVSFPPSKTIENKMRKKLFENIPANDKYGDPIEKIATNKINIPEGWKDAADMNEKFMDECLKKCPKPIDKDCIDKCDKEFANLTAN